MQDRIPSPGKEGRVLITPEDGSAPFYATIAMADGPLQEGTELSSTTLLQELTAGLYGMGREAVPNDVFAALSPMARYHWKRRTATLVGTPNPAPQSQYVLLYDDYHKAETMTYYDSLDVDEGMNLTGVSPVTLSLSDSSDVLNAVGAQLVGKYVQSGGEFYRVSTFNAHNTHLSVDARKMSVSQSYQYGVEWEELSSLDPDAYPSGIGEDGYDYVAYGKAMENAAFPGLRTATGTYKGGTFADRVEVDMGFRPSFLVIFAGRYGTDDRNSSEETILLAFGGRHAIITHFNPTDVYFTDVLTDTGFSITANSNYEYGMNAAGITYHWFAIGYRGG